VRADVLAASGHADDPRRLRSHGLAFDELKSLAEYLERLRDDADASLDYFRHADTGGFAHRVDPATGPQKSSIASTATCLAYLRAAGKIRGDAWDSKRDGLRLMMVRSAWESAGLPEDNPFTVSFLLDAIEALGGTVGLAKEDAELVESKLTLLNTSLQDQGGGLSLANYPRTAFLTHKAVRVLVNWAEGRLSDEARIAVKKWTWDHLYEESMLIASDSPDADFFELAYAVLTASLTSPLDRMTPRERRLLQYAIDQFFTGQRTDGTWPRSRPLFLYPGIGYAYCYDFELLVQLVSDRQIARFVFPHLDELRRAAWALESRRVPLEAGGLLDQKRRFGWSSEHHGRDFEAESWPTASVFHFCFELGKLVSEAIRRDVFDYVDAIYEEPRRLAPGIASLDGLMDSEVQYEGGVGSFKSLFGTHFLAPLVAERDVVRDGRSFSKGTSVSAIMYGPPGTSKTMLAGMVAEALGWPLLALDPSHLTRRGMDNVHAEADSLFGRLRLCDQIVVLLDEFDELVRERGAAGEMTSRFLTTAMLPKIAALSARRRIVYLVATNHVDQFDAAISRPGRFDVIVPVMPPTLEAKLTAWPQLAEARNRLDDAAKEVFVETVSVLTHAETRVLADRVAAAATEIEINDAVERARQGATLLRPVRDTEGLPRAPTGDPPEPDHTMDSETWQDHVKSQMAKIRGLGL
jgi:ATPase family associated with various cellular activities (AAA)